MALTAMVEQDGEYLKLGTVEEEARLLYDVSGNQTLLQTDDSGGTLVDRLTISNAGLGTWAGAWTVTGAMISNGNLTMSDDILLGLGTGNTARLSWDTTDANANELLLQMPAGGAVDVPVLAIGQSIESVDLGLFNGVVDPTIAIFGIGAVTTSARLRVYKARGTIAAPTAVTTGDDLFQISAYAAVAAGEYRESVRILLDSMGTIATTRGPGRISLQVATDAAPDALTERVEITASGLITLTPGTDVVIANATGVIVGHTAQVAAGAVTSEVQMHGTAPADSSMLLAAWSADTAAPRIYFAKSRGALGTLGTTIVTGDLLGQILAYGDDSADFNSNGNASAEIRFVSEGTIAADRIPGVVILYTATNAAPSVITEALRITSGQVLILGTGEAGTVAATGNTFRAPNIATGGAGNIAGADLTIAAGLGTGTGDVGTVIFSLPIVAAAGDNIQTTATRMTLDMVASSTDLTVTLAQKTNFEGTTSIIFNEAGADVDFRIETASQPYAFSVDAGANTVGVGAIPVAGKDLTVRNILRVGVAGTATGVLEAAGTTSGVVTVTVAAAAGTWTLTLPTTAGEAGDVLVTDGAGVSSWVSGMRSVDVQVTNAQMLALLGTDIVLVAAPGANRAIIVHGIYMYFDVTTTAYTIGTSAVAIGYGGDGVDIAAITEAGFLDTASDAARWYLIGGAAATPDIITPVTNQTVVLRATSADMTGGNTANTLSVRVYYSVVDHVAFT